MINNLGGMSVLEMNIIAGEVIKQLGTDHLFLNLKILFYYLNLENFEFIKN